MNFQHEIVQDLATLEGVFYEQPSGEFLEAPVLSGSLTSGGGYADLSWTKPESTIPIIGYHLIVDGVEIEDLISAQTTKYSVDYQVKYDFQVRAIGPTGVRSNVSNTVTITGGGLPDPRVFTYSEYKGASIVWPNLANYDIDSTIEGYNVYISTNTVSPSWTKLNSSTLGTDIRGFTSFVPQVGEETLLAMTYLYDGGQESEKYYKKVKPWADNSKYIFEVIIGKTMVAVNDIFLNYYHGGDWIQKGLLLKDGATVRVFQDGTFGSVAEAKVWIKKWLGIYFNGTTDVVWWNDVINNPSIGKHELRFEMDEANNCSTYKKSKVWTLISNNWGTYSDVDLKKDRKDRIAGGWYHHRTHTIYGPSCESNRKMTYMAVVNNEDVLEEYNLYNDKIYPFYKKQPGARLEFDEISSGIHYFNIESYRGAPWLNVYVKQNGGSYGSPENANPIKPSTRERISINFSGYSTGAYKVKVEYLFFNKTVTGLETNEVTINI